ncbi:hypothetical protein GGTG_06286 [Gaeumannomyces tritici R3-111a-1]|uniref:IBR domain-containing protein n=1 Tax=Gaeumannomyces tritici (strain R3-111a-1) TaxID=644352 RepID=J3NYD3_GAET3|nr:hypothetical protein GGTG_06286 [Gaeumannomyces tritici R3-111a-1]EJT76366.1 hypothetical protein GGTG_06286 [Gaeumannomyces tritici R3-111a-1]
MCNLAVLNYKCGHKDSLLIYCPKNDPAQLCEAAKQTILACYQFDGNCMDCHGRWCTKQDDMRLALLNSEIDSLVAKKNDISPLDLELMMANARSKAITRDRLAHGKEDDMEGDIRFSKEWAIEHAKIVWNILYHETEGDQDRLDELEGARLHLITAHAIGYCSCNGSV